MSAREGRWLTDHGRYARKQTEGLLALVASMMIRSIPVIEISYHFALFAWGNGYATVLTRFCVTFAHVQLAKSGIRAFIHPRQRRFSSRAFKDWLSTAAVCAQYESILVRVYI